jgi:hypothetical protein
MNTGTIVIPQWICSHGLTLEELGLYTVIAAQHHYQEQQPNPQQLATTTNTPIQKIKDTLNSLVAKGLLVKGTTAYRLQFGTITITPPNGKPAPVEQPTPAVEQPTPAVEQAARALVQSMATNMPELAKVLGGNTDSIISLVGETLDRGVTPHQIYSAIGTRTLVGTDNVPGAIAYRLRGLVPPRNEIRHQPDCPLHRGQTWDHCHCCKGEIHEGQDPYAGREDMRPDGWFSAYPDARRLVESSPVVE